MIAPVLFLLQATSKAFTASDRPKRCVMSGSTFTTPDDTYSITRGKSVYIAFDEVLMVRSPLSRSDGKLTLSSFVTIRTSVPPFLRILRDSRMLADVPTGNLEPSNKGRVLEILLSYARGAGATLVTVTHDSVVYALHSSYVLWARMTKQ